MATQKSDSVEKSVKSLSSNVTHLTDAIPDSVRKVARDAAKELRTRAGEAFDSADVWMDEGRKVVKKNPMVAVLAGFGVGFLLGAIILSRRD